MNSSPLTLVLGATGKTGSRVAAKLEAHNVPVRRAGRSGTEVVFDWDDATTHGAALEGVERIYLIGPLLRTDFAAQVGDFLDLAQAAGTRHVTYLSMHDLQAAPAETAQRRVELDLAGRVGLTHTILRPAWFMQNFSESFLAPLNGTIVVPTGNGAEAFVDVEDVAAVATETLLEPTAHHSAQYAITGPEALTVAQAAAILGQATGETIRHQDIDRAAWAAGLTANGVPADYAEVVRALTETIATGRGAQPTDIVARVTGSAPRSFADFAQRLATNRPSTEAA
ncbi:MAG TPA: NmrA family NAD(P)-binding protein [Solirubrobacteraceae bacterium]|jgi:uncharacterized protein YbjT (DUF2867 family)